MKIIFDSEEQKEYFIENSCVQDTGITGINCTVLYHPCAECWKNSGVEMEVRK